MVHGSIRPFVVVTTARMVWQLAVVLLTFAAWAFGVALKLAMMLASGVLRPFFVLIKFDLAWSYGVMVFPAVL